VRQHSVVIVVDVPTAFGSKSMQDRRGLMSNDTKVMFAYISLQRSTAYLSRQPTHVPVPVTGIERWAVPYIIPWYLLQFRRATQGVRFFRKRFRERANLRISRPTHMSGPVEIKLLIISNNDHGRVRGWCRVCLDTPRNFVINVLRIKSQSIGGLYFNWRYQNKIHFFLKYVVENKWW